MALLENTAEGGVVGDEVTTLNTGGGSGTPFTQTNTPGDSVFAFSSTGPYRGSLCYEVSTPTAANASLVDLDDPTPATSFTSRLYVYFSTLPSALVQAPVQARNSSAGHLVRVEIQADATIRLIGGSTTGTASASALALNTWYRFEFYGSGINSGSGSATCDVYVGDSPTLYTTASVSGFTTAALADRLRYGKVSGTAVLTGRIDDIAQNVGTATPLGISVTPKVGAGDGGQLTELEGSLTVEDDIPIEGTFSELGGSIVITGVIGGGTGGTARDEVRVFVDWARDGSFTGVWDDVTGLVRGPVSCSYGRGEPTALSPVVAGSGSFELDNSSRRFSPRNTDSPIYGRVRPRRPVLIERTVGGVRYTLARMFTDSAPVNPDPEAKRVGLQLVDALAGLRGVRVTTELHRGVWTGQAVEAVLDAAGWTGGRQIDKGATIIPWFWAGDVDALDVLQQLLASEGAPALLTVDTDGSIIFRDRHHRLLSERSTVSRMTWWASPDKPEPVMNKGFTYDDAWERVVNEVSHVTGERGLTTPQVIWETDDTIALDSFEEREIPVSVSEPFCDADPPREGAGFTALDGVISSTLSQTSGTQTVITLLAGEDGAKIQGLSLTAQSLPVRRQYRASHSDPDSIEDFGPKSWPGGSEPEWAGRHDANSLARLTVRERADPLPSLSVRFVCGSSDGVKLGKLLSLDLSDRVTVIEPETGLSEDFFIESIEHDVASVLEHEIRFGLELAPPPWPSGLFRLDHSTLYPFGTDELAL